MAGNYTYDAAERLKTIMRAKAAARQATIADKPGADQDIEIMGLREGDIIGRSVTIMESACVRGTVRAQTVVIQGTFSGKIEANRIHVLSSAYVQGELHYHSLAVHPGAQMEADCIPASINRHNIAL